MTESVTDEVEAQPGEELWRPPYVAYTTLVGLLDNKLGTNPIPPRIDRGFLDSYAGSVQAMLLSTLKTMGLIADDGTVLPRLKEATRSPALRKTVFKAWAEEFYVEQQALAEQNATAQMLHESFARRKITGSTLRKAVVFYLGLVEDVGMTKSPHFKPPKQAQSAPSSKLKKRAAALATKTEPNSLSHSAVTGETLNIDLGAAGSITVAVDVRWLQLPIEKFSKLRAVLAELESLGSPEVERTAPTEPDAEPGGEGPA